VDAAPAVREERSSRPPRDRKPRRDQPDRVDSDESEGGWNGPVPSFLGQGFGS
jgi:hypothetical protein